MLSTTHVRKRNGEVVIFDGNKITDAIFKAAHATGEFERPYAELLAQVVVSKVKMGQYATPVVTIDIETIQDQVETVLLDSPYKKTAKAYILYREMRSQARDIAIKANNGLINQYLEVADWKVKENSNTTFSLQGMNNYLVNEHSSEYWLNVIYPPEIRDAHKSGDFHIHDLGLLASYCCGWSLEDLLLKGFTGVPGKVASKPAKHFRTALGQLVNFLYSLQGECVSEDTEVLTEEGWKFFYMLKAYDKVCTLDMNDRSIRFIRPTRFIRKYYSGKMVSVKNSKIDQLITPEHDMVITNRYSKQLTKIKAESFKGEHNQLIPKDGIWHGKELEGTYALFYDTSEGGRNLKKHINVPIVPFIKFLGWYLSEGSHHSRKDIDPRRGVSRKEYTVSLSQSKEKNFEEIIQILNDCGFNFSMTKREDGVVRFAISSKILYDYVKQFGKQDQRFVPSWIKSLAVEQLELFYDAMMKGDGTIGNGNICYATISKQLADDMQEIGMKLGLSANIRRKDDPKRGFSHYIVSYQITDHFQIASKDIKQVDYNGMVYCVETPAGTIYTRRNGKASWTGNCAGAQAVSNFDTLLAPFVRHDKLDYPKVKQAMQEFIFGCNVSTRVGFQCVPDWYECLTPKGWATHNQLKVGDEIYVKDLNTGAIKLDTLLNIKVDKYTGDMIKFHNDLFAFAVTPEHQVVRIESDSYIKAPASSLCEYKKAVLIPVQDSDDPMQAIDPAYMRIDRIGMKDITIWCPTTLTGTFICRNEFKVPFITGNCPFLNITMDLKVPNMFKDTPVIIGGKHQETTYGDYQPEVDMINRAFCEVMTEGDASGRIFSFPIPTYSITKDFDWDNPNHDYLFEMTGKLGVPYFCLEENTRIIKADMTTATIGQLKKGDFILNDQGSPTMVLNKYEHISNHHVSIRLENGEEIVCSHNHRWPTQNGLKMAKELSLTDHFKRFSKPYLLFENSRMELSFQEGKEWFNFYKLGSDLTPEKLSPEEIADQLKPIGGSIVYIEPKIINNQDPSIQFQNIKKSRFDTNSLQLGYPSQVTKELGRFLGYLIGDGGYSKAGRITFTKDDSALMEHYVDLVKQLFDTVPQIFPAGISPNCLCANINSINLTRFLRYIGLTPCKGSNKTIPRIIYQSSKETMANFLGGLFDTDGHVRNDMKVISYSSNSEKLIKQIQVLLMRFGILSRKSRIKQAHTLIITGDNVTRFQDSIPLIHQRKQSRLALREETSRNSLGDPLFDDIEQIHLLENKNLLPEHCKYKLKSDIFNYRNKFYRTSKTAIQDLFDNDLVRADAVIKAVTTNQYAEVKIESLRSSYDTVKLVDIEVDCPSHLFLLDGGIVTHNSNFVNSDMSPEDSRSMCPLHGDTKINVVIDACDEYLSLEEIYNEHRDKTIEVLYASQWRKAKIIKVDAVSFYEIAYGMCHSTTFEGRHLQPVKLREDDMEVKNIEAKFIKEGMLLPIRKVKWEDAYEWVKVTKIDKRLSLPDEKAYCFEVIEEGSQPYFELSNGLITHNCRLRLDNRELRKRGGGLFGASPLTGSINVITLNLPRLGYISKNEEEFMTNLDALLYKAKVAHTIKRKVLDDFTEKGLYPYTSFYLSAVKERFGSVWQNHFSTIGIIGMNEAVKNLFGTNLGDPEAIKFTNRVLDHIRDRMIEFQEETGCLFNLEATPAEGTSYSLALKDKKKYPEILTADYNSNTPMYTNSTHLPVNFTDDIFELLDLQDEMQTKYTGGTVIHLFLGERIREPHIVKDLVRKVCANYRLPYFSISPTFSTCDDHGYIDGEECTCPTCGKATEIFSRIVGYYRPTRSWNEGKQAEFEMRKTFKIKD